MSIRINTESRPYFGGLGDSILLAWLSEGAKGTEQPIELWASGPRRFMLECLGQRDCIANSPDNCIVPSECYSRELADNGNRPRWEYVCEFLGIKTTPKQPTHQIPDEYLSWAKDQKQGLGSPLVLLFPQTHWQPRAWPSNYWCDLSWQLKNNGMNPVTMLDHDDPRYSNAVRRYWGYNLGQVAALMLQADVIIGNDSAPAHLAGTLGCKTIALMGPTKPTVFSHIMDVNKDFHVMASNKLSCTGCHFAGGPDKFRAACDIGCMSLYSLLVPEVIDRVKELLGQRVLRVVQ